jgi:hypothetical protein
MSAQSKDSNYLIKRLLNGKPDNDYENLVSIFMNLFLLDFDSELNKSKETISKKI